jgi:hypothetical protein
MRGPSRLLAASGCKWYERAASGARRQSARQRPCTENQLHSHLCGGSTGLTKKGQGCIHMGAQLAVGQSRGLKQAVSAMQPMRRC